MNEELQTKQKLLDSARADFLEHGFKNASLRRICKNAGVTTGALYFFFKNKEDIFEAVISEPLALFGKMFERLVNAEFADASAFENSEEEMIRFLLRYRTEVIIILEKSEGTKYEGFKARYLQTLEGVFAKFFRKYLKNPDPKLIHVITAMRFYGYL
ncbi:MAG: TetR/AcrR family transcriptional regulator [Ruminococcus sp.]|nr:TetR/AcrR family transcriptional regulator [Ruminococcus sp.]